MKCLSTTFGQFHAFFRTVRRHGHVTTMGHDRIILNHSVHSTVHVSELKQVWMMHLFNLVDLDSLQQLSDVP